MFSAVAMPIERPTGVPRTNSQHSITKSTYTSPASSRKSSVASITSIQTDPGVISNQSRQSSATSVESVASNKSGFRSLFGKKEKKPKEKKNVDKIVLTSRHAAAVNTKLMMDAHLAKRPHVKTAGITQSSRSSHSSAAAQEARHPHSGPPVVHVLERMPSLTRIQSGDEQDEEDEMERLSRAPSERDLSTVPGFTRIREQDHDESPSSSADHSSDEGDATSSPDVRPLSPGIEKALLGTDSRRPLMVTKNSYGGRFHKDEKGCWTRCSP